MKILIVTANFAPRGASPAVRTVHIAKYLSLLGHEVEVVTYDEDTLTLFSGSDAALANKVPSSVSIRRIGAGPIRKWLVKSKGEATVKSSKKKFISNPLTQLLIPDPHMDAILKFIRCATVSINAFDPDVVMTFGYPYSMHIVGSRLKKKFPGIFWIADYGDPWAGLPVTEIPRPNWRRWLDKKIETSILRCVDLVTLTSKPAENLYIEEFRYLSSKTMVVEMGYDPDDFKEVIAKQLPSAFIGKKVFVHAGRVYPAARNPRPFIEAIGLLKSSRPDLYSRLKVVLVGETDPDVIELIDLFGVEDAFHVIEWVPMAESIEWMKAADYLLLFGNKGGIQVPGKVYQYIGTGGRIFMTCDDNMDPTATLLQASDNSTIIRNDPDYLFKSLSSILENHGESTASESLQSSDEYFSWPQIVKRLCSAVKNN